MIFFVWEVDIDDFFVWEVVIDDFICIKSFISMILSASKADIDDYEILNHAI